MKCRIDREHDGFIAIEDLHLFFGEEISVGYFIKTDGQVDEIKACIMQTFGELKTKLTEIDLELIMNTKMITTNRAEELVKQQVMGDVEEEEDYQKVTNLFSRVSATEQSGETPIKVASSVSDEEVHKRCQALQGVDQLSSQMSASSQ